MKQHQIHQRLLEALARAESNIRLDKQIQDLRATDEWRVMDGILRQEIDSRTESLISGEMDEDGFRERRAEIRMLRLLLGIKKTGEAAVTDWISEVTRLRELITRRQTVGLDRDPTDPVHQNGVAS